MVQVIRTGSVLRVNNIVVPAKIFPTMVPIQAGQFKMGSLDYKDEQPIRNVQISAFHLGRYPITNGEYLPFLVAAGQDIPELVADPLKARHPVVNVSWNDAVAYCQWLNKDTERRFRLPTEAEWEYAARGTENLKYPWGNEWDPNKAVFNTSGTDSVDTHPEGASPFGVLHMAGNVWEWVNDFYGGEYSHKDLVNPKGPETGTSKVLRGGSWYSYNSDFLRGASRPDSHPEFRNFFFGFRLAEDKK